MSSASESEPVSRGLVLGGGGITGIAWETGLVLGLQERGVDLTAADVVVGTSAGSVVGAQLRSGTPVADLYGRQTTPPTEAALAAPVAGIGPRVLIGFAVGAIAARGDIERFGRVVGRQAQKAAAAGRTPSLEERFEAIASRLTSTEWPDARLLVATVDVETGRRHVLDGTPGPDGEVVELLTAVAASCAVPGVYPPVPVGGRDHVDGGAHAATNADLAAHCDRVVVIAPTEFARGPFKTAEQSLRGTQHVVLAPDAGARTAIGKNVLDPRARVASAEAGYAQAARELDRVAPLWG